MPTNSVHKMTQQANNHLTSANNQLRDIGEIVKQPEHLGGLIQPLCLLKTILACEFLCLSQQKVDHIQQGPGSPREKSGEYEGESYAHQYRRS
jgi:hypothetical protein